MEVTAYHRFVALVEFDQRILAQQKAIRAISDRLVAIDRDIEAVRHEHEQALSVVRELRKKRDALELEVRALGLELGQKQKKLENTADVKAYSALEHEISSLLSRKSAQEEAVFMVWQELEDREKAVAESEASMPTRLGLYNERRSAVFAEYKSAEEVLHGLEQQRIEKLQGVLPDWLTTYEAMRQQYLNPVVQMRDNCCSGCGFPVPSGDRSTVFRRVLIPCQQCRRLLVDPHVVDELGAVGTA